jgi:hypothetical protein
MIIQLLRSFVFSLFLQSPNFVRGYCKFDCFRSQENEYLSKGKIRDAFNSIAQNIYAINIALSLHITVNRTKPYAL